MEIMDQRKVPDALTAVRAVLGCDPVSAVNSGSWRAMSPCASQTHRLVTTGLDV